LSPLLGSGFVCDRSRRSLFSGTGPGNLAISVGSTGATVMTRVEGDSSGAVRRAPALLLCRFGMEPDASVTRLIHLLRADDKAVRDMAASLIWQRYFRDLLDLARKNLDKQVRRRADEEDVLQSMFQSFCARQVRGEFDLADRDELWRLLVTITLRKARNAARNHHRAMRAVAREPTIPEDPDDP